MAGKVFILCWLANINNYIKKSPLFNDNHNDWEAGCFNQEAPTSKFVKNQWAPLDASQFLASVPEAFLLSLICHRLSAIDLINVLMVNLSGELKYSIKISCLTLVYLLCL